MPLPEDVHIEILEWGLYRASQAKLEIDYPTLRAASLTCRSWRSLAQRVLFRRLELWRNEDLLIPVLKQNRSLGQHVRSLIVFSDNALDMASVLECCPHTVKLVLRRPWNALLSLYHAAPRLHALDLQIAVLDVAHRMDLSELLKLWPSVQFLLDSGHYHHSWSESLPLSGLLLGLKMTASFICSHALEAIIPPELNTLRELEIDHDLSLDTSTYVIIRLCEKIGPWLTSLDGLYPPQADLHEYLRSLEQVIFCDLPSWSYTFPPSVRRVGYHHRAGTEPARDDRRMLCFLAALEALPHLQLVTATCTSGEDILIALETTCRLRSVEFIIYTDAESFPRARNVDWV